MGQRQAILGGIIILFLAILFAQAGAQTPVVPQVVINEVAWMGTGSIPALRVDEWIELFNNTDQPIDLTGWTLEATDGSPAVSLTTSICTNLLIPARGFLLLERTNDSTISDIAADCIYTGALEDGGEQLALKDETGTTIDTANTDGGEWPAGDKTTRSTMERIDSTETDTDNNWGTNDGITRNGLDANSNPINGTPKQPNSVALTPTPTSSPSTTATATPTASPSPTASPTQAATSTSTSTPTATPTSSSTPRPTSTATALPSRSIVINEVAWMGTAANAADEWLELKNNTGQPINLAGWTLRSGNGSPSIDLASTIPANGYFLLERTDDSTVSDITADFVYTGGLSNAGETLSLRDPAGNIIDTANADGGAWPAGDNPTKSSMERIDPTAPDTAGNWATNDGVTRTGHDAASNPINGTPKQINAATLLLTTTPTPSPTASPTSTATPTLTPTSTTSPTATSTPTSTSTSTSTSTATHTPSSTPTTTATATQSITPTSTSTSTGTPTPSPTATGTRPPSATPGATSTPTATPSASTTATATPTATPSATATATYTPTTTETATGTATKTPTATLMATDTPTATPTFTATSTPTATAIPFQPRSIVIDEVAWVGTQANATDEWIELRNNTGQPIDLAGWTLTSNDGSPNIALAGAIPANGYFLLERTDDSTVSDITADLIYTGGLSNAGETLSLRDPAGNIIDTANADGGAWPAGDNPTKSSMERVDPTAPDTAGNWATNDGVTRTGHDAASNPINGTPKQVNAPTLLLTTTTTPSPTASPTTTATFTPTSTPTTTPTPATAAAGSVLINEVVTDPQQDWNDSQGGNGVPFDGTPGAGANTSSDEWLELLNTAGHTIDLTSWTLVMRDTTPATQTIGEGSATLRFSAGGSLTNFRPGERLVIGNPTGVLNNDVYIELRDASGQLIDDVEIGDDFEADGSDGAPGASLNGNALTIYDEAIARVPDGRDTNNDRTDFEKHPATIGKHNGNRVNNLAQLPSLNTALATVSCEATIEIQNVGAEVTKAIILFWDDPGSCPPQCAGPVHVSCTGLLKPGSSWHLGAEQLPSNARAGAVFSAFGLEHPAFEDGEEVFADALCETLFEEVQNDCGDYRRFRQAFDERAVWDAGRNRPDFNFAAFPGQPITVEVTRQCRSEMDPAAASGYTGIRDQELGQPDPSFGGYAYYAPLVYAGWRGWDSALYIQNAGLECTNVELWFRPQGECRRSQVCEVPAIAPGESQRFDAGDCAGPDWVGNVWLRSSQPAAMIVDTTGPEVLTTYQAMPAQLNDVYLGELGSHNQPADPLFTPGSQINFGPLIFREHQGWDTRIQVQNLSSVLSAKIKVYFLDEGGDLIHSVVDWICPRSSQAYTLAAISGLPGNWVGQVRVESQDWLTPGNGTVPAPNIASVAQLTRWSGPAQAAPVEAMSYDLLSEEQVFDWQTGGGAGGLESGAGLIAIPSLSSPPAGAAGINTQLAIQNAVVKPGVTDFVLFLYDQNGLLDFVCESLSAQQVEYINLADWSYVNPRFVGSAVISAIAWDHPVMEPPSGGAVRNLLGLAAVKTERFRASTSSVPVPAGDQASAIVGIPLASPSDPSPIFGFAEQQPACPR